MSKVDDYIAAVAAADLLKPKFEVPSRTGFTTAFVDTQGNLIVNLSNNTLSKSDALLLAQFILDQYR